MNPLTWKPHMVDLAQYCLGKQSLKNNSLNGKACWTALHIQLPVNEGKMENSSCKVSLTNKRLAKSKMDEHMQWEKKM